MPEATLTVTLPEEVWMGELTRQYPEVTFQVLSALPQESSGVVLAEITGEGLPGLLEEMREYDDVVELVVLNESDGTGLIEFETSVLPLLLLAQESGMPISMPFSLSDGVVTWELTASHDRLSELGEQLDSFGLSYNIESLRYQVGEDELLTDAQRELVETAIEMGYYETPRECSLTDVAAAVGRAKSTVSEMLHRAEGTIIKEVIDIDRTKDEDGSR